MNPLGALLTLLACAVVLMASRRYAALGMIAAMCYLSQGQMVVIGGFHFTAIRMILLVGMVRIMARGELSALKFNSIDKSLVWYVVVSSVFFVGGQGTTDALVGQLGITYNVLLSYFLFRCLFQNFQEVEEFLPGLAYVIVPMSVLMLLESINGRNLFYVFGGIPEMDMFRDGHYRCSAAFRSPITAGTVGASFLPLFIGLFWATKHRQAAIVGIVAATAITLAARSSGPVLEYATGIIAFALWKWPQYLRPVRWGILLTLIALNMVMKAPVWFLIGHISDVVGGGGWHRAEIINQAVNHRGDWWLSGTDDTGGWMATQLESGGADLTDQYVVEGVHSGLLAMMLFIWIIVRCFSNLGLAMRKVRETFPDVAKLLWALGAALLAHVINFFSVSYFDQVETVWYLTLAMIASASFGILKEDSPDDPAAVGLLNQTEDFEAQSNP